MKKFTKVMAKVEFMHFAADLVEGNSHTGHVNKESGLTLSNFRGWDDWFGFGEWNGERSMKISCYVEESNKSAIRFLMEHGFQEEES